MQTATTTATRPPAADREEPALGPILGLRRPRYEILDEVLGPWLADQDPGEAFFFTNVGTALRVLFSEYGAAQVTAGEMRRHPRLLASGLANLAAHYRHYAWTRHGRQATVVLYHSSSRCAGKVALCSDYKAAYYSKRVGEPPAELAAIRQYADFNLRVLGPVLERVPNAHLVDTGPLDPEAWPWALMAEGRAAGPRVVLSGWRSDLQYVLAPGGATAVLRAQGEHTRLATAENAVSELLRESKTGTELAAGLSPGHLPYLLALCGDPDLGAPGLAKVGPHRAAQLVLRATASGRLPPDAPSLRSLLEEAPLTEEQRAAASLAWGLLSHADYAAECATPAAMAAMDAQLANLSGLGELEGANTRYFDGRINLDLLLAGEEF